jgi:pyruvate/2-oxoglutarate dehydrogenase complex dihydrolipoamide acyltransferase (E2) component
MSSFAVTTQVKLPNLGENVESGDVVSVLVDVGDVIELEQGIVELETDKATVEVPSTAAGRVVEVHVSEGDTIDVGGLILTVEDAGGDGAADQAASAATATDQPPAPEPPVSQPPVSQPPVSQPPVSQPPATEPPATAPPAAAPPPTTAGHAPAAEAAPVTPAPQTAPPTDVHGGPSDAGTVPAGPSVRRLAREMAVDLALIQGSGKFGRITRDDVHRFRQQQTAAPATAPAAAAQPAAPGQAGKDRWGPVRTERVSKLRMTIAERMLESVTTIPQLTNFDDADVTELEHVRRSSKKDYAEAGVKLTSMPFIIKAVALALEKHPVINASIEMENRQIIYKDYISVGIAVDTPRGLVVPVLRNLENAGIPQIAKGLVGLSENARSGNYTVDDLRGATFTISNLGAIGGTYSTPIINPPQVAILLVGRTRKMPAVVDDEVAVREMMPLSLTYDHRLVDGAAAAHFLNEVKGLLESPTRLLLAP